MENLSPKNVVELITKGGIVTILAFIIMYFGSNFLTIQSEMQKDLSSIRMQLVKVQGQLMTQQKVEKIVDDKIKLLEYHYHNKDVK